MWNPFKCRLFRDHDYEFRRTPHELFLECRRCGHRSNGWTLPGARLKRANNELRLLMAEPGEGNGVVSAANGNGTPIGVIRPHSEKPRLTFARPR